MRMPISQYLRDCDIKVIEAASADEAITVLSHNETTVDVVLDIEMPGIVDGFGLAKWIREHRPGMDVLWPVRCRALSKTPRNFVKKARCRSLMTIRSSTDHIRRLLAARSAARRTALFAERPFAPAHQG